MRSGMIARVSGSSPRRLFQSQRSKSRDGCGGGANGFVHDSRRWKNGQRRNMPPGASSAEITAWGTPSARSEYEVWSAPGPLPTTISG